MKFNIDTSKMTVKNRGDILSGLGINSDTAEKINDILHGKIIESLTLIMMDAMTASNKESLIDLSILLDINTLTAVREIIDLDVPNNAFLFGLAVGSHKAIMLDFLKGFGEIKR